MSRIHAVLKRIDGALSRGLDRALPESLKTRYILALGLIAALLITGQVLSQISLDQQITNSRLIHTLEKTTQSLQLSQEMQMVRIRRIEFFLFLATLLILLLEALYVFRPAVARLYRALRARADFMNRMGHELRNPLNSILGMNELLMSSAKDNVQKSYLSVQRNSGIALLEMLTSLLDRSSNDSDQLNLDHLKVHQASRPSVLPRRIKVLIVDDSTDNLFLLRSYMENARCSVEMAENGRQALEMFKGGAYDLVLMDIEMPEMNGYEAVSFMRCHEKEVRPEKSTPIMAISAYSNLAKALDSGFSRLLVKPVTANILIHAVSDIMGFAHTEQAVDPVIAELERKLKSMGPRYLENRRGELADYQKWIQGAEYKNLERAGHRMKGNALSYGFPDLGLLGGELELAAKAEDGLKVREAVARIEVYLAQASREGKQAAEEREEP